MFSPWKKDFPALANNDVSYLDTAATCQVPKQVIKSISGYLTQGQGNAGRGLHRFSEDANEALLNCRGKVAEFITCQPQQLIFTKGATESINFVAASLRSQLTERHSILVTEMEHHANLLPWQRLCEQTGARLNILSLKINDEGNVEFDLENLDQYLQDNCQLFAMTHCSNILGHLIPIKALIDKAKNYAIATLVDGAQSIPHSKINLIELDCDYYAFSGHKLYAPSGSGVLFAKLPENLQPLLLGGGIAIKTTTQKHRLSDDISRFEAGTTNMSALVGLTAAIDYIQKIGYPKIVEHEKKLHDYFVNELLSDQQLSTYFKIISHRDSHSLLSFYSDKIHSHDIASILAEDKIAVRAGHHCAEPCLNALGYKHCVRASVGLYNESKDIERLIEGLRKVIAAFA